MYPTLGTRVEAASYLVSNTSLDSGHDSFVRCQHRHFVTNPGNDEEINMKKNFKGRY